MTQRLIARLPTSLPVAGAGSVTDFPPGDRCGSAIDWAILLIVGIRGPPLMAEGPPGRTSGTTRDLTTAHIHPIDIPSHDA